ncbi:MAG TPA: hypothetical protein VMX17_03545, partial [Candidatus Glassbacteria bacterium]|nr:hypothetical protein [Candidatus Glassbacteria bacterium]
MTEDAVARLRNALNKKQLTEQNFNILTQFDRANKVKGLADSTRFNQIQILITFAETVGKDYTQMTRDDVEKYFAESKYSKYSDEIVKIVVRKFFKWMNGGKEYPDMVAG